MKWLYSFLSIFIVILMFGGLTQGAKNARATEYIQTAPLVVTASSTSASVTLLKPLMDNDITAVTALSSSDVDDTPAVSTYTSGSKALAIIGLAENTSRTLYITYNYAGLDATPDLIMTYMPLFLVIGLLILVVVVFLASKRR
jgi:hypothetical protein